MTATLPDIKALAQIDRFPRTNEYPIEWIVENEMGPNVLWLTEFLCEAMGLQTGMRVLDLGCGKAVSSIFLARVFPIHADARNLPFANEFFDAIVSIDAFEYFGTDATFLPAITPHLKPGGQIGMVNAGVLHEIDELPQEWPSDFSAFHTVDWWRRHWTLPGCVDVERADDLAGGRDLWLRWHQIISASNDEYLTSKAGENLGFHRVVARRRASRLPR